MSSHFRQSYGQVVVKRGATEPMIPEFIEAYPALQEVMGGVQGGDGQVTILPHSLILFWEGDRMKFCLSRSGLQTCAFGVVPDPLKALESVDTEIALGRFEWKAKRSR